MTLILALVLAGAALLALMLLPIIIELALRALPLVLAVWFLLWLFR